MLLELNGQNTFADGVTLPNPAAAGWNPHGLYIGSDTGLKDSSGTPLPGALGTGPLRLGWDLNFIHASDGTGSFTPLTADGQYRRVNNQIIWGGMYSTTWLGGNLLLDRNEGDTWTIDVPGGQTFRIFSSTMGDAGIPTFGKNFQISGSGSVNFDSYSFSTNYDHKVRILSDKNTYRGGTQLTTGLVQIGADAIKSRGAIQSGPFGTGTLSFIDYGYHWNWLILNPYSDDGSGTERRISNPISFSYPFSGFTVSKPTVGNTTAHTLIFEDTSVDVPLPANKTTLFTVTAGATLQFNSKFTDGSSSSGFIKQGPGDLVLTNPNNSFSGGITVQSAGGRVIGHPAGDSPATLVNIAAGSPGVFGSPTAPAIGSPGHTATSDAAFDKYSTDFSASGSNTTDFVIETQGAVHFGGTNPFYLVNSNPASTANTTNVDYGPAFIVGGNIAGSLGTGFQGSGVAYLDDGVTFNTDNSPTPGQLPGWLVVPHLIRDGNGADAQIGINLRVGNLDIRSGEVKMTAANRLSGVEHITLSGGVLRLDNFDQSLLAPRNTGEALTFGSIHVTAGSVLQFGQDGGNMPNLNAGE